MQIVNEREREREREKVKILKICVLQQAAVIVVSSADRVQLTRPRVAAAVRANKSRNLQLSARTVVVSSSPGSSGSPGRHLNVRAEWTVCGVVWRPRHAGMRV